MSLILGLRRSPGGGYGSILAWEILWTEEPGELQSVGSELDTTETTQHACIHSLLRCDGYEGQLRGSSSRTASLDHLSMISNRCLALSCPPSLSNTCLGL